MNRDTRDSIVGSSKITYSDTLPGYRRVGLNIVQDESAEVEGVTFEVNDEELANLDRYEGVAVGLYKQIQVTLASGETAIAYQKGNPDALVFAGGMVG